MPSDMYGQQHCPQLMMPATQNMAPPMKPAGSESYPSDSKSKSAVLGDAVRCADFLVVPSSVSTTRAYEYSQHGMTNWMSADVSPSSSKPGDMSASSLATAPVALDLLPRGICVTTQGMDFRR